MQKDYWKLKAIELEGQVLRRQLQDVNQRFEAKRRAAYAAAGLDPDVLYTLDDTTETFTPETDTPKGDRDAAEA